MAVNRDRLLKLAEIIELEAEHFDMRKVFGERSPITVAPHPEWCYPVVGGSANTESHLVRAAQIDLTECGTTACIAGWALHLWSADIHGNNWADAAQVILGLDQRTRDALFTDYTLDAKGAAARLREIADNG